MPDNETRVRVVIVTYFPMFIATLSLITAIYNGYLNSKFIDIIQQSLGRGESMRTCKEIIDAYFQVKFRANIVSQNGERERTAGAAVTGAATAQVDAMNAVNKIGALGTYLANMRDDAARERYTHLTRELEAVVKEAPRLAPAELPKRFEAADVLFDRMNEDCIRAAKQ
jgi:hypothetical protein